MVLICISRMANDVEHRFMCYWPCVYLLCKKGCLSHLCYNWVVILFLSCKISLCVLDTGLVSRTWCAYVSSPSWVVFHLGDRVLGSTKALNFDEVHLSLFSFVACAFGVCLGKCCLLPGLVPAPFVGKTVLPIGWAWPLVESHWMVNRRVTSRGDIEFCPPPPGWGAGHLPPPSLTSPTTCFSAGRQTEWGHTQVEPPGPSASSATEGLSCLDTARGRSVGVSGGLEAREVASPGRVVGRVALHLRVPPHTHVGPGSTFHAWLEPFLF